MKTRQLPAASCISHYNVSPAINCKYTVCVIFPLSNHQTQFCIKYGHNTDQIRFYYLLNCFTISGLSVSGSFLIVQNYLCYTGKIYKTNLHKINYLLTNRYIINIFIGHSRLQLPMYLQFNIHTCSKVLCMTKKN